MIDGVTIRNIAAQGQNANLMPDMGGAQEVTVDYAAGIRRARLRRPADQPDSS